MSSPCCLFDLESEEVLLFFSIGFTTLSEALPSKKLMNKEMIHSGIQQLEPSYTGTEFLPRAC